MKRFLSFHIYLIPLLAISIGAGIFYAVSVSRREDGKNGSVASPEGPQCAHWAVFRTAQLLGIPTQPGDVQRLLPNNSDGHSLVQVIETLAKIGIKAEGYRDNWETLATVSFPCIVHLTNPDHYIVVSGIERERGYVHIFDDAGNRTRQRRDVFEKRWSGYALHVEKDAGFFVSKNQKDAPLAVYEHLILDKGDIPSVGEPTEFVYPVRNNGNENLVIEDIKVSCGCLKSEKPDEPIPPGGNGTIKLFYTVEPKRGVFAQSAAVKTNDPNNPIVVLTACGFTGVDVRVEPSRINLDRLFVEQESIYRCFVRYTGEWNEFEVELESNDLTGVKLLRHQFIYIDQANLYSVPNTGTGVPSHANKNIRILELVFEPTGNLSEKAEGSIILKTNVLGYEHFTIKVSGVITAPIRAFPSVIRLANDTECSSTLISMTRVPFRIIHVEYSEAVSCKFDSAVAGSEQIIRFKKTGKVSSERAVIHYQLEGEATTGKLELEIFDDIQ